MYPTYSGGQTVTMGRVLPSLFLSLVFATLGVSVGQYVPDAFILPLAIVQVIMIFTASFIRRKRAVGFGFVYAFTFISGLTLYPVINQYLVQLGPQVVIQALGVTLFAYGGAALYAVRTKADFNFLGGFLFMGIMALLGMGIVQIFVPFSHTANMVYTLLGIFIFIGYTLFDVSRISRHGVTQEDVPWVVLSLYLDFVNLFLFILRLFGLNIRRD